jgi:ABC-type antimicrobial peptide transport system permease subunit
VSGSMGNPDEPAGGFVRLRDTRMDIARPVVGAAGAYTVARVLASILPTVPTRDPAAAVIVTLVLIGCALLACYLPARRAVSVDPLIALRTD